MKALVTGGAGFIGSHVVDELLFSGNEVIVVDNLSTGKLSNLDNARQHYPSKFSFFNLDILDENLQDFVVKNNPDVIFHLAAQSSVVKSVDDPLKDAYSNIIGSLNVFEGAKKAGVKKIVYAASGGTLYGQPQPDQIPVKETSISMPISPYGISKKTPIEYLFYFADAFSVKFTALAIANAYGPRQDPFGEAGVVSIFAHCLLNNRPVTIFGDGTQTRDFIYVKDVAQSFVMASEDKANNMILNVSTGKETSINELFDLISSALDTKTKPIYQKPRKGELYRIALDPLRASLHLGFKASTSLEIGISHTLKYLQSQH